MNIFCRSKCEKVSNKISFKLDKLQLNIYNLTQKKWGINLNLDNIIIERFIASRGYDETRDT